MYNIVADFPPPPENGSSSISTGAVIGIVAAAAIVIILLVCILRWKGCFGKKSSLEKGNQNDKSWTFHVPRIKYFNLTLIFNFQQLTEVKGLDLQMSLFNVRQVKGATNNFDISNKIGEGGFGPVYKVITNHLNCHTFIIILPIV